MKDKYDKIIIGIDPGTNVMGYSILGIKGKALSMEAMGVIRLNKFEDHYLRLRRIYERVLSIVEEYLPDEMAIEAPFFGKNVQSMLKLGRAQGVAIAAALSRDVPIHEYEPRKIKQVITGNGAASKEQVKEMLRRELNIPQESLLPELDATDALAAALCHYIESNKTSILERTLTERTKSHVHKSTKSSKSWKEFIAKNPDKVK